MFSDSCLRIAKPYGIQDLVHRLRQVLTAGEIDEFTDLWVAKIGDPGLLIDDNELKKQAIARLDLRSLANDNLEKDGILDLARDVLDADVGSNNEWLLEQIQGRNNITSDDFFDLAAAYLSDSDIVKLASENLDDEMLKKLVARVEE